MAPHKPSAIVLDSWSVIAYLEDEPSAERVEDILAMVYSPFCNLLIKRNVSS